MIVYILRNIVFAFQEAVTNLRINKGLSVITIGTIAVSMTLFGIFFLIFINLQRVAVGLGGKVKLFVYLKDTISHSQIEDMRKKIVSYHEVEKFSYISKEDALSDFRNRLKDKKSILDGLGFNPLPASFIIEIKEDFRTLDSMENMERRLSLMEGVEDIEYGKKWIDRFETIMTFLKLGMIAIGGVLVIGLLFIISNTIKLSVYSRHDEIEIMKLVGATNRFIKGPFIIEGMIQGFLGGILSIILLIVIYKIFISSLSYSIMPIFGIHEISFIQPKVIIEICISGLILGFIG
ncbi:MAG: permease-like cell division protein FtsX, partial [Nitrospinota bacterium]